MPTKEEIKAKLCIDSTTSHYPLMDFVDWIEQQQNQEILQHLVHLQHELQAEDRAWRKAALHRTTEENVKVSRWCFYCAQVKAYYEGLVLGQRKKQRL